MRSCIQSLKDGTRVLIRPVVPSDREGLRQGVRQMSRTSRHMRFFQGMHDISESMLDYFTIVDQVNHVAWCAVEPVQGQRGYGIARYRLNPKTGDVQKSGARVDGDADSESGYGFEPPRQKLTADFAVAVIDDLQGKGLGTLLLAVIYRLALAGGVQELCGEILPENPVMPQWIVRLGGRLQWDDHGKQYLASLPVVPVGNLPADSSTAERFVQWIERLDQLESAR